MAYTPTTWATGDVITADKLNNIEQGIVNAGGGGGFVIVDVEDDGDGYIGASGCFQEIQAAFNGGQTPVLRVTGTGEDPTTRGLCCFLSEHFGTTYTFASISHHGTNSATLYLYKFNNSDQAETYNKAL